MTAEQGIQIFNSIHMQMDTVEQNKFKQKILEQVEDQEAKINRMIARLSKKYPSKCKNR